MSTPTIQLAFQGGGAKLAAMLPVAHAFAELENDKLVAITSVSGSSAGAICAALVATRSDFKAARKYIVDKGASHFASLVPTSLSPLIRQAQSGRLSWWSLARHPGLLIAVALRGRPLLNNSELRTFIHGLLDAGTGGAIPSLEDGDIKIFITASDIVKATAHSHTRGNMVTAVEDSCSLPVLLRSFDDLAETHLVDGGLCDNLPVDYLAKDSNYPIFAVYPEVQPERRNVSNIVSYFLALMSASINHSVSRSMAVVSKPFRFPVQTDVGLIQFDRAIEQLADDDWYNARMTEAADRIRDFARSYGFALSKDQARVIDTVDVDQYRAALESLTRHRAGDFRCLKSQFIIRVNSDRRFTSARAAARRVPDTVTRLSRLEVLQEDVRFYRAKVNVSADGIVPTVWSARNATTGRALPIRALPMDQAEGLPARNCLLEFLGAEDFLRKGDIVEIQSVYHSQPGSDLAKLNVGRSDYFGFTNASRMPAEEAELILIYPKPLGEIAVVFDAQRSTLGTPPSPLDLSNAAPIAMDVGNIAVGLAAKSLRPGDRFFAMAIPQ